MTPQDFNKQLRHEEFQQRPGSKTDVVCRCGKAKMLRSLMGSVYAEVRTVLFCRVCYSECTLFRDTSKTPFWNPPVPTPT